MDTKQLRELAEKATAFMAAGYPIEDPHDTYPTDLWCAMTQPDQVTELLDEIDRLRARVLELEAAHEDASGAILQAVAAERERWATASALAAEALRELERYEYATATLVLRKAVAAFGA